MIDIWQWQGDEPNARSNAPAWVIKAYERGQILTVVDRKTDKKRLIAHTTYGEMSIGPGGYILVLGCTRFIVLTGDDLNVIKS